MIFFPRSPTSVSLHKIRNKNLHCLRKDYICKMSIMFPIDSTDISVFLTQWPPDIPATSLPGGSLYWDGREWKGGSKAETKNVSKDQIIQNLVTHKKESALDLRSHGQLLRRFENGKRLWCCHFVNLAKDASYLSKMKTLGMPSGTYLKNRRYNWVDLEIREEGKRVTKDDS